MIYILVIHRLILDWYLIVQTIFEVRSLVIRYYSNIFFLDFIYTLTIFFHIILCYFLVFIEISMDLMNFIEYRIIFVFFFIPLRTFEISFCFNIFLICWTETSNLLIWWLGTFFNHALFLIPDGAWGLHWNMKTSFSRLYLFLFFKRWASASTIILLNVLIVLI